MKRLLYYPNFDIDDENFLKFALLYIDEIKPIIPHGAENVLRDDTKRIMNDTNLIRPYAPNYNDGCVASEIAIQILENKALVDRYRREFTHSRELFDCVLYEDKYNLVFENYCLENHLGIRCNEGIRVTKDTAYTYMSVLADVISKETELDIITDDRKYSDYQLKRPSHKYDVRHKYGKIQNEIQFYLPVDIGKIPLKQFIDLRADQDFECLRSAFAEELQRILKKYDDNEAEIDFSELFNYRNEVRGILQKSFFACASIMVAVVSFRNMLATDVHDLNFWERAGTSILSYESLNHGSREVREFLGKIAGKMQARRYLAKIRQMRPEII